MAELIFDVVDPTTYPTLTANITNVSGNMTLSSAALLPATAGTFSSIIDLEQVTCTYTGSGTTVALSARGVGGTTAAAHLSGAVVQVGVLTKRSLSGALANGFTIGTSPDNAAISLANSLRIGGATTNLVLDESGNSDGLSTGIFLVANATVFGEINMDASIPGISLGAVILASNYCGFNDGSPSTGNVTIQPFANTGTSVGNITGNITLLAPVLPSGATAQDDMTYKIIGKTAATTKTFTHNAAFSINGTVNGQVVHNGSTGLLDVLFTTASTNFEITYRYMATVAKWVVVNVVSGFS